MRSRFKFWLFGTTAIGFAPVRRAPAANSTSHEPSFAWSFR